MKRLVFISNMAAPHQVKFCYALQDYFDAEFWFYVRREPNRPPWWEIPLGDRCKILGNVLFRKSRHYLSMDILKELRRFDPDIVMLGGFFFPSNFIAYKWAKKRGKKVLFFSEVNRSRANDVRRKGLFTSFTCRLYADIDALLTSSEEATQQFKVDFGFGDRVHTAHYATDLDAYFKHPARKPKENYSYLFANRLVEYYNPHLAINVFNQIRNRYPSSQLVMNGSGPLREPCLQRIRSLGIERSVRFLDDIRSWDELSNAYRDSDILLLPATFSAGNFTILEAMASGMGIIVSNKIFGSGTYIKDGVNGFVREPTMEGFVAAVQEYINRPELMEQHALVNRAIAEKYSCAPTAKLYHDLIMSSMFSQRMQ
jgi:glycosyltransferase involved in cell wall biosynthesis